MTEKLNATGHSDRPAEVLPEPNLTQTQPEVPTNHPQNQTPAVEPLETNPDYIALCSTLSLLKSQKKKAEADIRRLQELKIKKSSQPEQVVEELMAHGTISELQDVKGQHIVRPPPIDWNKYKLSETENSKAFSKNINEDLLRKQPPFAAERIFDGNS